MTILMTGHVVITADTLKEYQTLVQRATLEPHAANLVTKEQTKTIEFDLNVRGAT